MRIYYSSNEYFDIKSVIWFFILSFHFRLKDRPGRLSFSYADLLAFLFSVDKSIGSGCFFPDIDQGFQSGPVPGTFTRLRSCTVPAEITEPPKISGGQNHKYDGR